MPIEMPFKMSLEMSLVLTIDYSSYYTCIVVNTVLCINILHTKY